MSAINIQVKSDSSDERVSGFLQQIPTDPVTSARKLELTLEALRTGNLGLSYPAGVIGSTVAGSTPYLVSYGNVAATLSVTFTGAPTAAETITVGNVVFTARASGATGNEFNIGGTPTLTAASFVTFFNASASVNKLFVASAVAGAVTITSLITGVVGNAFQVSSTLSNTTVGSWTGGATTAQYTY